MNFNYEKIRSKVEHGGNQWTGYSDLFLVLSVVFLLLYVIANLRSGAVSIASQSSIRAAKSESEELRKQIKAYEVVKEDYLKKDANEEEVQLYQELMGKLTLLEDGAQQEKKALYQKAKEAEDKEQALNHYQAVIKNIINANLVAQSKLKKREDIITDKETVIVQKNKDIAHLGREVKSKEIEIDRNNSKIGQIEQQLEGKIQQLRHAYKDKKKSKEMMEQEVARLRNESEGQIQRLRQENNVVASQLHSAKSEVEKKSQESQQLLATLSQKEKEFSSSIAEMKRAHEQGIAKEKGEFEKKLHSLNLSAEAKIAQERAYREGVERKNQLYNEKLKGLGKQLADTQGSIESLKASNQGLQRDLAVSNNKLNEQRRLAQSIKEAFGREGINADVDLKTGDVTVKFENEYFDTGSASLKPGMKHALEKMLPVYARSLFHDSKIVKRISNVEIIGFASPTYQGKYVDPDSLTAEDRKAVNFNMDLSYQRAKGIFEHVFDQKKMSFPHQKQLLPLVKVSGRSYLATDRGQDRGLSSDMTMDQYCKLNDCRKSQKVIIKFNLKDE